MTKHRKKRLDKEWLKIIYIEMWKQYIHEDQLLLARGTIFVAFFTAILASPGLFTARILSLGCVNINQYKLHKGLIFLGILWVFIIAFLRSLTKDFEKVNKAGQDY